MNTCPEPEKSTNWFCLFPTIQVTSKSKRLGLFIENARLP
jgi:hypothetical protein